VPVGEQKGQALKWYAKIFEGIINIWKWWNIKYAIPGMMRKIFRLTEEQGMKFDLQIINGDVIESEYNERGMIVELDCLALRDVLYSIPSGVGLRETYVVPGDHELGYRLALSTDPKGGISGESLDSFFHVIGPLWQTFVAGGIHFITLSSSLMMQKLDHLPLKEQSEIKDFRLKQEVFIQRTLEQIPEGKTVFVFLHDPDAISKFDEYIRDYYYMHNKNIKVFCGHMHAEWSLDVYRKLGNMALSKRANLLPGKIHKWAKGNRSRLKLFEKYQLQIVPAPGGMMGLGGGFLILTIHNAKFRIDRYKV
ncbi:MAG: metallophosphoesterase, partial [Candidatus Moranbacteria bacterium]|jgi:hypothetical protein|nr:metallophosphoesterase [Candidatus Moranbacteria bacterium]